MKSTLSLTLLLTLTHTATSCSSFSINKCQFLFEGNRCAFSSCALSGGDGTNAPLTSQNWTFCISSCCGRNDPSIAKYYKLLIDSCPSKSVQEDEQQYYLLGIGLGVVLFIIISLYCQYILYYIAVQIELDSASENPKNKKWKFRQYPSNKSANHVHFLIFRGRHRDQSFDL